MKKVAEILIQCIDDIKAGRDTLAGCLERHPHMRKQLEPLLNIALNIKEKPDIKPSEAFKMRTKANLMEHIYTSRLQNVRQPAQPHVNWFTGWTRAVAFTVAAVLIFAAAGAGTAYASRSSLPGDTLYSAKLTTEQLQKIFTFDAAAEVELELKFAGVRLDEMEKLAGMPADQTALLNGGGDKVFTMSIIGFIPAESKRAYITQAEKIQKAAAGYVKNLNSAIVKSEQVSDSAEILEKVALAILAHLERFDEIEDKASGEMVRVIATSKAAAFNGHMSAVQNLAAVNPIRANEINLQAIQNRLERAQSEAAEGNSTGSQDALQEMEKLRQFGNEIPNPPGGENQEPGADNETNSPAPGDVPKTPGVDNSQSSQGTTDETNPPDQGQGAQNQPQQDGQENSTVEPSPSPPETVPGETNAPTQQPGQDTSDPGRK